MSEDPMICRKCNDREYIFSMPGHPDDGQVFQCGIKEENKRDGTMMFYCPYFRGVLEADGDKVKCKTNTGTCLCQPENHNGKGACGKPVDADTLQKAERRRYVDAEIVKAATRTQRPVIIAPEAPSPHRYLDPVISEENMDRVIERLNVDQKIARASVREEL